MQDPKNFGCLAYAFVPAQKQFKLGQRARKVIIIRYKDANGYKAYGVFDPSKNIFFFSRTVKFDESTLLNSTKPNQIIKNGLREEGEQIKDDVAIFRRPQNNVITVIRRHPINIVVATIFGQPQTNITVDICHPLNNARNIVVSSQLQNNVVVDVAVS